ncbi:hypothetical protein M2451_000660 [Dysgonomonas sp. PFB1-18]|uniref:DUF4139 domain-containing protein n=1 Tax=unclassified Dysgonomonas TaxID=2630389 RepID=UPI0024736BE6|nr:MULTISPECIES: mucoidy inhibitor MuiA family protein [unclassified Dysgonomonas]MDH6307511.1 hypothetical protein [Dysgonomonas sp. PF1-14]MDH6337429.1 hypothetical protein [Dysgonomonas sp. PF1-16]MDH6379353.1 hypothetical protein [Dysgonomonas sp. PFB1-18]MDH6396009.1 hypothetical protein [Dysgonomonas sp. PF1-23]
MKKHNVFIILILMLFYIPLAAQDQKEIVVKSEVSEATVFINGAQVLRKKAVDLLPGKTKIRFTNLSPYIDAKSVQIKMDGEVMVMSVNHQSSFVDSLKRPVVSKTAEQQIKEISEKITTEQIARSVVKDEMDFLSKNQSIGGANTGISLTTLRETTNFYRDRMSALRTKDNEIYSRILTLEAQRKALQNEGKLSGDMPRPTPIGEVVVDVECKRAVRANIELSYYVANAGWNPTYDIRALNVDKPIQLIYKANVRQNTKEDWNNVKLKISSADPNAGNIVPQLKTYYLNYYTAPPKYDTNVGNNQAAGVVVDAKTNEPLIGVSVAVHGTTIGTMTDVNGRFSLAIPQNGNVLSFSYIGYIQQNIPISRSFMNVRMVEDSRELSEVVVVGYGTQRKSSTTGAVASVAPAMEKPAIPAAVYERKDIAMPTAQVENQTSVEFEIKTPYTVKSDNKNTIVEVDRYELPAEYEYFAIPKISKEAFLLANISDWEKYNLLDGEANIFFDNTYIGKTILETRYVSDTLNISLGKDKSILVSRDKVKDLNTKKFFGNKKEDTRAWKITVRNNKRVPIDFVVLDQIPVPTITEIEVETENLSKGVLNAETGEVKWKLNVKAGEKKDMELRYKVKYPKDKTLTIE